MASRGVKFQHEILNFRQKFITSQARKYEAILKV